MEWREQQASKEGVLGFEGIQLWLQNFLYSANEKSCDHALFACSEFCLLDTQYRVHTSFEAMQNDTALKSKHVAINVMCAQP